MTSRFQKTVLSVGTYESPEGSIDVTPERLKHWESVFNKIDSSSIYQIPVHWNHAELTDIEGLAPVRKNDSANDQSHRTVGHLTSFSYDEGSQSAVLEVELKTEAACEAAEKNIVFVSPVLFDCWQDGNGESYSDLIGSVDLVDLPVDYSQGPFVPAVSQSEPPTVIRLSTQPNRIYRLSTEGQMDDENTQADDAQNDGPVDPPATQSTSVLSSVISGLQELKIVLPADTNTENFLDRLNTALMTAAAQSAAEKEDTALTEPPPVEPPPVEPVTPVVATMSTRINQLEERIVKAERQSVQKRLDTLLESGRCSPAEHKDRSAALGIQRMSLATDGSVQTGDVGLWLGSREVLPAGACWDPAERIKRMSTQESSPKKEWTTVPPPDTEELKRQKAEMLGRRT